MMKQITKTVAIALILWFHVSSAFSETGNSVVEHPVVERIEVQGAKRIEQETVKSYLTIQRGDPFMAESLRESIQSLYDTGFFKDVVLEREGDLLIVRVIENPMVHEISFEGHEAFSEEELKDMLRLKPHSLYNRAQIEKDLTILRQAYRIKGLFLADIELLTKSLEQNRVDLVYKIQEGEKSKVRLVRIVGNEAFSDKEIQKHLMIQPTDWLSWFTEKNTYDREKLLFDQEQLRNFYLDRGYIRVQVDSSVAEITPDRRAFTVTHTVQEGKRFKVGVLKISGDFDELPSEKLREKVTLEEGAWFSREDLRDSMEALVEGVGDFGYAFVDVRPETVLHDDREIVDIHLNIIKGRRVYVNRIEIIGNTRTRDEVIRREVRFSEGDRYSVARVRRSKERLDRLGFFETIEFETRRTNQSDRVDVIVNVEEKSTGAFTVGAGFSSSEKVLTTASVSQKNFLGRGQFLKLSFMLSSRTTEFDFAFTEPYFMNWNMSAGFDLFNKTVDHKAVSSFKERSVGGTMRLGFRLSEHMSDLISHRISRIEVTDVDDDASETIKEQERESPFIQSMLSNTLSWDDVDSRQTPSRGRRHRLTTDLSGLGGDVRFARLLTDHSIYHPLLPKISLVGHLRGRLGLIGGLGDEVPVTERFFLGGSNSLRGFKPGGVGPRTVGGDAVGGYLFEQVNAELMFPFFGLGDKGVRGITFLDAGYLHDPDTATGEWVTSGDMRASTGVAVHWSSPFGPLRFTLGVPLLKETMDETRFFDFSFGTSF